MTPETLSTAAPARHWLADACTGVDYALVISSCAGLWAYIVGDTVRLVDLHPPRLLVTGRLSYFLSAFGEHLTGEEVEAAVSLAAKPIHSGIADFAAGAVFPDATDRRGGHVYIVEFSAGIPEPAQLAAFGQALDDILCRGNDDYRAHRSGGFGLRPPEIVVVPHGAFAAWMKQRGRLGGQHKVPRIITECLENCADLWQDWMLDPGRCAGNGHSQHGGNGGVTGCRFATLTGFSPPAPLPWLEPPRVQAQLVQSHLATCRKAASRGCSIWSIQGTRA